MAFSAQLLSNARYRITIVINDDLLIDAFPAQACFLKGLNTHFTFTSTYDATTAVQTLGKEISERLEWYLWIHHNLFETPQSPIFSQFINYCYRWDYIETTALIAYGYNYSTEYIELISISLCT